MDEFGYFVLYTLPYFTLPFYLAMVGYRFWVWFRFYNPAVKLMPGPLSIFKIWSRQYRATIEIFPGRRSRGVEWVRTVKGLVFFTGLFKRDRTLWVGSWLFHVALVLVLAAHLRVVWRLPVAVERVLGAMGAYGGVLLLVSAVYLLVRRLAVQRVREITSIRDYLAELLFLGAAASGYVGVSHSQVDLAQVRAYLIGLLRFSEVRPAVDPTLVWHLLLVQVLLVTMPFSHLMHFGGIFLSRKFLGSSDTFAGEFGRQRQNVQGGP